ncbi:sensor histidine kinase [Actinomadura viridis]|uniref:histidine kinase n=1 Tax=Actinomadura viridis TaxID=58110 RepID=A0A931GLJ1_9ACTN|nr:HAMP domain-containing sensor histidine kinase [Actinomadura viridis]MBG6091562.1 signal transduction histidine kinase [Actinomadura viridis]
MQGRVTFTATVVSGLLLALGIGVMFLAVTAHPVGAAEVALAVAMILGFFASLAAVAWVVRYAVKRALRPVRTMRDELGTISDHRNIRRVTVPSTHDDVADLARCVNVALDRIEQLVERQRAFAAEASHELRSPLTGLRTRLELGLEHPEEEDWPETARAVLDDADRMQQIIADLLTMAKLEAGVLGTRGPIDLGELVRAETARRRQRVPIEIETDEGVMVSGARTHLIRVLTNLLDNADRHARTWIRVAVGTDGRDALLMVADDGPGIPPEERERVFQRFQRLDEGRRCEPGGTGLGLAISRDIAKAHGGELFVGDSPGGARLVLRLPLIGAQDPASSAPPVSTTR